jgi:hypothetical protein
VNFVEDPQSVAQKKIEKLLQGAEDSRKDKRVKHCLRGLFTGDFMLLKNDELVRALPGYLAELINEKNYDRLNTLLSIIGQASLAEEIRIRERAVMILALAADALLLDADAEESIVLFSRILVEWLSAENEFIEGYEVVCLQLQRVVIVFIRNSNWHDADSILKTLDEITTGACKKKASMRSTVSRMQNNIARQEILEFIFLFYLKASGKVVDDICSLLVHLGRLAVLHVLSILRKSKEIEGRERLVRLLVLGGNNTAQIIHECMQNDEPWFLVCDMVHVLCQMKDGAFYPIIEEALRNCDQRVQNEVLMCIFRTGGPEKTVRLMRALQIVDDPLKILIVKELSKQPQAGSGKALCSLLNELLAKGKKGNTELLSAIVTGLQKYPDENSLKTLGRLIAELQNEQTNRALQMLVAETRSMLESELRHKAHRRTDDGNSISFTDDPVRKQNAINSTMHIERQVAELIADSKVGQASELLFLRSVECAREKDFEAAERLRDRLLEVDSGAIDKVIEADKIIQIEQQSRIPVSHLELWHGLRTVLGEDVYEEFYNALETETYLTGNLIAKEGERDGRLYFLNSGEISLHCKMGSSDSFLKRFRAGSIMGMDQFFSVTVWTATVKAASPVELQVLTRESLAMLEVKFQDIEKRIHDYCQGLINVPDLLKISGVDRRNSVRYRLPAKIMIQLFDAYGKSGQRPFVSLLQDISLGGFCFTIGISNPKNTRLLLGRQVHAKFLLVDRTHVSMEGTIVGVIPDSNMVGSYKVNVKFIEMLTQAELKYIINTFKR